MTSKSEAGTLLTLAQFADWYGVHVKTASRWANAGRIPTLMIGRTIRVDVDRLRADQGIPAHHRSRRDPHKARRELQAAMALVGGAQ